VIVEGGTPEYSLVAEGKIISRQSLHEFVILGFHNDGGINVTVTDAKGKTADFWVAPFIMPSPGAEAGPEMVISCADSVAVLQGSSPTDDVNYYWTGPDADFDFRNSHPGVDVSGTYHLKVVSKNNGCYSFDSTVVYPPEIPVFEFTTTDVACFGDSLGTIAFTSVSQGSPPYSFSIDGGKSIHQEPFFDGLPAGEYALVLRDQMQCGTDTTAVLIQPKPEYLDIVSPVIMSYAEEYQVVLETSINDTEIMSISWSPAEGLSCSNCLDPVATPDNSIIYVLELIDTKGCSIRDTLHITVEKDLNIYIPNVFSPNGDGMNDVFFVKGGNGVERIISLEIFNRWGSMVFTAKNVPPNDPFTGWDGLHEGRYLSPGVFIYLTTLELSNGKEVVRWGDVSLIR
jgi:gliding motility-associated-like protein